MSLRTLAQRILRAVGEPNAELGIELVGDRRMRRLNGRYRRRDISTDVLAFAMRDAPGPRTPLLGDVVISLQTAVQQAKAQGSSLNREVAALLVHGIVHLCGYDHERSEKEARRMRRKEQAVLRAVRPIPTVVETSRHLSSVTRHE